MDDFDFECDVLSDSEMLDDAPEEAWYASPDPPLQVAHVVNGDILSGSTHRIEPAVSAIDCKESQPSTGLDMLCGGEDRPASPHVDSQAHIAPPSQQDISKNEMGNRSNVLAKIESIFEAMVDVLLNERGQLTVAIKTRPLSRGQPRVPTSTAQTHAESVQHLCFPGKTEKEAWRFGERGMRSSCWRHDTDTRLHSCRDAHTRTDPRGPAQRCGVVEAVVLSVS